MNLVRLVVFPVWILFCPLCAATAADAPVPARKDDNAAITALRESAILGNGDAQYKLGLAYIEGRGVAVDPVEGFAWMRLAAEKGVTGKALHTVLESLSVDQLTAARRRLAALRADNPNLQLNAPPGFPPNRSGTASQAATKPGSVEPVSTSGAPGTRDATISSPSSERKRPQDPVAGPKDAKQSLDQKSVSDPKEVMLRPTDSALARADTSAVRSKPVGEPSPASTVVPTATIAHVAANEASAALQRERDAHLVTQATLEDLRTRLTELSTSRAAFERETASRLAVAERKQRDAVVEADKRAAEKAELSDKLNSLATELRDARSELATVRENLAATSAKAVSSETQASEIAALKKALLSSNGELEAAKAALADAKSKPPSESLAAGVAESDLLNSLRNSIRVLDRDLESATRALKRVAAEKAALEAALVSANQELANANNELPTLRRRVAESDRRFASGGDQAVVPLRGELNETKFRLSTAQKQIAARDEELKRLREIVAAAESRSAPSTLEIEAARRAAKEAQQQLAAATDELTALRPQVAAVRELESRVRQLEAEKANARPAKSEVSAEEFARIAAALATAEAKLSTALKSFVAVSKERDELSARASAASELEARVRQLELEKGSGPGKDEFARVVSAKADAESKLSTALRSYTLLARERDELRARLAQLSPSTPAGKEVDAAGASNK